MSRRTSLNIMFLALLSSSFHCPASILADHNDEVNRRVQRSASFIMGRAIGAGEYRLTSERERKTWAVSANEIDAEFDAETGLVVEMTSHARINTEHSKSILTRDSARLLAEQFLTRARISLQPCYAIDTVSELKLDKDVQYTFNWYKRVAGITMPACVSVTVDAETGKIVSYGMYEDCLIREFSSKLTGRMAAVIGVSKCDFKYGAFTSIEPVISYIPMYPGRQTLIWRVECSYFTSQHSGHATILIGAETGELVAVYKSESPYPISEDATSITGYARKPPNGWDRPFVYPAENGWYPQTPATSSHALETIFTYNRSAWDK